MYFKNSDAVYLKYQEDGQVPLDVNFFQQLCLTG